MPRFSEPLPVWETAAFDSETIPRYAVMPGREHRCDRRRHNWRIDNGLLPKVSPPVTRPLSTVDTTVVRQPRQSRAVQRVTGTMAGFQGHWQGQSLSLNPLPAVYLQGGEVAERLKAAVC